MSSRPYKKSLATSCVLVSAVSLALLTACGSGTRGASTPQQPGQTTLTSATLTPRIDRLVVAEQGMMSMVARDGCIAQIKTADNAVGGSDELRIRCPKADRLSRWFEGIDRLTSDFSFERVNRAVEDESDDEVIALPAGKIITESGKMMRITKKADVERLAREVRILSAELAQNEEPSPGPASANGWQMLHVSGSAHVLFAGHPTRGVLDARVSTNGQYLCEFVTNAGDGPLRTTKSGYIAPQTASKAIDEVLAPFNAMGPNERSKPTFAAGMTNGSERRSNVPSTVAVFERFAQVQQALGDACLPALESPASQIGL